MEALLIYLLKASGILAIFYLAYQLFLKRETFFFINRHFLMAGILTALLLPFVSITNYVEIAAAPINLVAEETAMVKANGVVQEFNWIDLLFGIYIMGLLIFTSKFIIQIISLLKLVKINKVSFTTWKPIRTLLHFLSSIIFSTILRYIPKVNYQPLLSTKRPTVRNGIPLTYCSLT